MSKKVLLAALSLGVATASALDCQAMAASECVADNAIVQVTGTLQKVENRDKHTRRPYYYFMVYSDKPYCITGADVDERSSTPTFFFAVLPKDYSKTDQELDPYVGQYVLIEGKIGSSNWGGPLLAYKEITPKQRDD